MKERLRIWLSRTAWLLLVLLLAGIVFWTVMNVRGSSRFESALRELKDAGQAATMIGLAPPSVPASENGAPYYSAAFALQVEPEDGELEWKKIRDLTPDERARQKAWIGRNEEAFDLVARARKRPRCRFDHDYRQGFQMLLPELAPVLKLSRALMVKAELQASDNDGAGARESVRSLFALADAGKDEPILVWQLVRIVLVNRGVEAIGNCVSAETGPAELREWRELVPAPEIPFKGCLEKSFRGEMGMVLDLLSRPPEEFAALAEPKIHGDWSWLFRPWLMLDGARYIEVMRRALEATTKPYPEARAEIEQLEGVVKSSRSWDRPVSAVFLPGFVRALDSVTGAQARLATVRAGLDAELEQRASGKYPESTGASDPFTGKPLKVDPTTGRIASAGAVDPNDPIEWVLRAGKK